MVPLQRRRAPQTKLTEAAQAALALRAKTGGPDRTNLRTGLWLFATRPQTEENIRERSTLRVQQSCTLTIQTVLQACVKRLRTVRKAVFHAGLLSGFHAVLHTQAAL